MSSCIGSCFAGLALTASISVAQTSGQVGGPVGSGTVGTVVSTMSSATGSVLRSSGAGTFTMSTMGFGMAAVAGAPYSGEQVSQTIQTLADGTRITRNTMPTQRTWRDSQGRTRTERQLGISPRPDAPKPPVIIEIRDPIAGVAYILDTQARVAHRITMQQPAGGAVARTMNPAMEQGARMVNSSSVSTGGVEIRTESLGNQIIEGVNAFGTRITTVYPVGYEGNDRPIVTTNETWVSLELRLPLLTTRNDPRSGETTQKMINLSRLEPDLSLFQPPADYSVVDESGPTVTFHYTLQ